MAEQKMFDLAKYILEKHNIQGEVVNYDFKGLVNIEVHLEIEYDMYMPVMINNRHITEGEMEFEYYTITDGDKFLINPYSIEIPSVDWGGDAYYIGCETINKEPEEDYEHWIEDDVMLILDKKIVLIERWGDPVSCESITKVIELGTISENTWAKIKMIGFPTGVITDIDNMNTYKKICEENKK